MSIDSVRKVIQVNLEKELYIVKSECLLNLHNFLLHYSLLDSILLRFVTILRERHRNCSTIVCGN